MRQFVYSIVLGIRWKSKKAEEVLTLMPQTVLISVDKDRAFVNVPQLNISDEYEYEGEVNEFAVEELVKGIVVDRILKRVRKRMKNSLKSSVYETLGVRVVEVKRIDSNLKS